MRWHLVVFLAACNGDSSGTKVDGSLTDTSNPGPDAPPVDPLAGIGNVEMIMAGYQFVEGPQWRETEGDLLFTDIPPSTVFRYTGSGAPTVFRMPSGQANGLAIDGNGAVIAAQHNTHSVTRDGIEIVSVFENNRLNSPNDVIVDGDGTIYFTDPPYGLPQGVTGQPFMGVFRIAPNDQVTAEYRGAMSERPNGIGLSLDSKTLYVADSGNGTVWKFPIDANGALGTRTMFAMTTGGADGLAIDSFGNVFVTSTTGIEVFAPSGTKWGTISVPRKPSNCAFGDADHKTLYITANQNGGALFKVRLANPGMPRR